MCRLKEDHLPGFDCLSNEQILPLLLAMDPESILNCGRASPRLYKLVCTQKVWRTLLAGIQFTKERLKELALFGKGLFDSKFEIKGSPEMMPEVVKEAARRFALVNKFQNRPRMSVAIQGWGIPDTFEMEGDYLTHLAEISEAVGAKFTITACSGDMDTYVDLFTFKRIAAYIAGLPDLLPDPTILASQHVQKKVLSLKLNQVGLFSDTLDNTYYTFFTFNSFISNLMTV